MEKGSDPKAATERPHVPWLVLGLGLFLVGYLLDIAHGMNMWDEAWFLQVADRVLAGEVLYRDVFCPVTPLSLYVVLPFMAVLGTQVLVLKAVTSLCFALTVLVTVRICRQLGSRRPVPWLVVGAMLAYAPPWLPGPGSLYTPLTNLFLLVCLSLALDWQARVSRRVTASPASLRILALAGVAAGLSFAAKQNVGVYAVLALLATVSITSGGASRGRQRLPMELATVVGAYLASAAAVVLPVLSSGGSIGYGAGDLRGFSRLAYISYFLGVAGLWKSLAHASTLPRLLQAFQETQYLLPFLVLTVMAAVWWREPGKRLRTATVFLFAAAGFLVAWPRADLSHVSATIPELLILLAYGWYTLAPTLPATWARGLVGAGAGWLAVGLALLLLVSLARVTSGSYRASTVPHFEGVMVKRTQEDRMWSYVTAIRASGADGTRVFLLSPRAGFFYLATGTKNPTTQDYPISTNLTHGRQAALVSQMATGRIPVVWVDAQVGVMPSMKPVRLTRYVRENGKRVATVGAFTMYSFR